MFGIKIDNTQRFPLVKICGITHREDAHIAAELGADAIGCICAKQSKRYLRVQQIADIFCDIPKRVTRVAVVVNPTPTLMQQLAQCHVDCIQFHGNEDRATLQQCPLPWYKAVHGYQGYMQAIRQYPDSPSILVDSPSGSGQGTPWSWEELAQVSPCNHRTTATKPRTYNKPIILAGGLQPNNLTNAIQAVQPYAVDTASGVEAPTSTNGLIRKDAQRMKAFIQNAHLHRRS